MPQNINGFLMKSKSPSCGVGDAKIYGKSYAVIGKSDGMFTGLIREVSLSYRSRARNGY